MSHVDEGTLHAYLDGELPSGERAALEAHVAQCVICRGTLAEERALLERASALLASARPVERAAPPFEQLRSVPKRSPWQVRVPIAWAASIAVALGIGYFFRNPDQATPTAVSPPPANTVAVGPVGDSPTQEEKAAPVRRSQTPQPSAPPADELVRSELQSRADSHADRQSRVADAAGAVAMKSPQLRNAPSASIVASGAPIRSDVRPMPGTTQWPVITRGAAASLLGAAPVGLPGLSTKRIQRNPSGDGTVVVEQALDSSTVIQIFQRPAAALRERDHDARAQSSAPTAAEVRPDRLARFVGSLRVEIAGPLSSDSLNRLLEQVEPLP